MKRFIFCLAVLTMLIIVFGQAEATLTTYSNRAVFNVQGSIVYNYGFEDWGTDFSYPGDPYTRDGVTYHTDNNIVVGTGTWYNPISNVFCNNYWSPLPADIQTSPSFNMFGLDLGYLGSYGPLNFVVNTNLGSYTFAGLSVPIASTALDFYGFIAGPGEYFTSFTLSDYGGLAPAIDNVTLGNTGAPPIPEPGTLLLLGAGLVGLVGYGKLRLQRRKK